MVKRISASPAPDATSAKEGAKSTSGKSASSGKSRRKPAKKRSPRAAIIKSGPHPVSDLQPYHKNPRIGDIDAIAESLKLNGQYRSIVVNRGNLTGRKNEILAGNHSFLAAKKLGWEKILVDFVDVDDDRARSIVLADNKTAENGTYDDRIIGQLLAEVPDVLATGFKPEEADQLISDAMSAVDDAMGSFEMPSMFDDSDEEDGSTRSEVAANFLSGGMDDDDDDEDDEDDKLIINDDGTTNYKPESGPESMDSEDVTTKPSDLGGISELMPDLPEDKKFWTGPLQLPKLRKDMYVQPEDLPEDLKTWAGSATRSDQPDDRWWFYPWGGDSTKGLVHLDQVIVSFYSWDPAFDQWFWRPDRYASKLIHSGIKMAVTPDWSMWDTQSRFMNLFSLYRNQYVGRYLQEVGIKTIQNIGYPYGDEDFLENFIFKYVPKDQKVYSLQTMTWNSREVQGEQETTIKRMGTRMLEHFQPEVLLLYGTRTGHRWYEENILPAFPDMKVIHLESRLDLLQDYKRANGGGGKKKTI